MPRWFPLDSGAPDDPKIRLLIAKAFPGGTRRQAAFGAYALLLCYVHGHGKGEPGLGVRADGSALPLSEMAQALHFKTEGDLVTYLSQAAGLGLIAAPLWDREQVVFLPAMWARVAGYEKNKGRKLKFATAAAVLADRLARPGPRGPGSALQDRQDQDQEPEDLSAPGPAGPVRAPAIDLLGRTAVPAPKPAAPKAPTRAMRDLFDAGHRVKTGRPAVFSRGKDDAIFADVWAQTGRDLEVMRWLFQEFFASTDPFIAKSGYSVGVFRSQVPKLIAARARRGGDGADGRDAARGRIGARPGKFASALRGEPDDV